MAFIRWSMPLSCSLPTARDPMMLKHCLFGSVELSNGPHLHRMPSTCTCTTCPVLGGYTVEQLSDISFTAQDPILRYGGMYAIGMAYRGTDNNAAIQKLLHFAVSDVSDDVRRAAVLCLGACSRLKHTVKFDAHPSTIEHLKRRA